MQLFILQEKEPLPDRRGIRPLALSSAFFVEYMIF